MSDRFAKEAEAWISAGFTLDEMPDGPFPYVYVNEDGSIRECSDDQKAYLLVRFSGADGARPYVKSSYDARTPDGKIRGFLGRELVPPGASIRAPDKE